MGQKIISKVVNARSKYWICLALFAGVQTVAYYNMVSPANELERAILSGDLSNLSNLIKDLSVYLLMAAGPFVGLEISGLSKKSTLENTVQSNS